MGEEKNINNEDREDLDNMVGSKRYPRPIQRNYQPKKVRLTYTPKSRGSEASSFVGIFLAVLLLLIGGFMTAGLFNPTLFGFEFIPWIGIVILAIGIFMLIFGH
ncbi:MAG TPA: hypothetical protein PLD00_07310 [Methanofastidiosum sp.]|jgi:hypothetical protein|nr:hypothetical protein [Methanofastidiosum sp.]HQC25918.1 hypothetical protein [Methanofastidiosum sp.]